MEGQPIAGTGGVARAAEAAHPGARQYVFIGFVLTVLTAVEVAAYYIEALQPILFHILVILSGAKFVLVVMYYMHLKFDSRIFTGVFILPFTLGVLLVIAMVVLFKVLAYI